jgi:hypothetical protein
VLEQVRELEATIRSIMTVISPGWRFCFVVPVHELRASTSAAGNGFRIVKISGLEAPRAARLLRAHRVRLVLHSVLSAPAQPFRNSRRKESSPALTTRR